MLVGGYSKEAKEKPLHKYQQRVAEWMLDRLFVEQERGAGVFLDPGLGKTRTTLTVVDFLLEIGYVKKVLIVAPLRPVYTVWPTEIKRWGFPMSYSILHDRVTKGILEDSQVELINFGSLHKVEDFEGRWDLVVVDESTFLKNWSTKRSKRARKIVKSVDHCVILTGTPTANSLADLHSQAYLLDLGESLGKTVSAFRRNFCVQKGQYQWNKWAVRKDSIDALERAVKHMVIRLKAEDHLDMPELVDNRIWCRMDPGLEAQYRKLKRELYAELQSGEIWAASAAAAYIKCRQFANGQIYSGEGKDRTIHIAHREKVKALLEVYEELSGKPLLVFYTFKHDLAEIQKGYGSDKPFAKVPVIQGGMKTKEVEEILEKWNDGKYPAILCQWQAASHGLNMQGACNDIACFGLVDSLETFEQAKRRVYRQGVKGSQVRLHKLLMEDTVDVAMQERLDGKYQTQEQFLEALKRHAKL